MQSGCSNDKKDPVLVRIKKCEPRTTPETKKFSIDREHATFLSLRKLIIQTFGIEQDFIVSYLVPPHFGASDRYLPILSEWDFHNAFYRVGGDAVELKLRVDVKHVEPELREWDIVDTDDLLGNTVKSCPMAVPERQPNDQRRFVLLSRLPRGKPHQDRRSLLFALNRIRSCCLSRSEFGIYFDQEGRLVRPELFRLRVYQTGCDRTVRAELWPLLLELYPTGLSAAERQACLERMAGRYFALVDAWHRYVRSTLIISDSLKAVLSAVRKDVIRTDRNHPFYAGDDDNNSHLMSLFNVIATYALCYPEVNYCQGMSDIASLLLFVVRDEALTYACFCAVMQRLKKNFQDDGRAMTKKFQDLSELIQHYDPDFYDYLGEMHADDLLFCYRWLLLEMKREFSLDDAALLMDVNLASMPWTLPTKELELFGEEPSCQNENHTTAAGHSSRSGHVADATFDLDSFDRTYFRFDSDASADDDDSSIGHFPVCRRRYRPDSVSSCQSCPSYLSEITLSSSTVPACCVVLDRNYQLGSLPSALEKGGRRRTEQAESALPWEELQAINDALRKTSSPEVAGLSSFPLKRSKSNDTCVPFKSYAADGSDSTPLHSVPVIIKASCELPVVDSSPDTDSTTVQQDATVDAVPVAQDAYTECDALSCGSAESKLTLSEIEGICSIRVVVGIVGRAVVKGAESEQLTAVDVTGSSEGATTCTGGPAAVSSLPAEATSSRTCKSRHASSTTTTCCSTHKQQGLLDSGFSESNTNYLTGSAEGDDGVSACTAKSTGSEELSDIGSEFVCTTPSSDVAMLPVPDELGDGDPFFMFVCLAVLLEHRQRIMADGLDFNDIVMYFDRLSGRHNVHRVLQAAKAYYAGYLRSGWIDYDSSEEELIMKSIQKRQRHVSAPTVSTST